MAHWVSRFGAAILLGRVSVCERTEYGGECRFPAAVLAVDQRQAAKSDVATRRAVVKWSNGLNRDDLLNHGSGRLLETAELLVTARTHHRLDG